jgi:polyhydroxyalkanoate synthase subunit PhaC
MPRVPDPFSALDFFRRQQGYVRDILGTGPRETPWREVARWPGARLRHYRGEEGARPLLILPAPFKRAYIWDLEPPVSVVRAALARGFSVFVLEWLPGGGAANGGLGLADFALRLPERAVDRIEALTGQARPALAGHSLGGTLAAIYAARRPERAGRLALVDVPLAFAGDGGPLAAAVAKAPPAEAITRAFGETVPGSAINVFSARAVPEAFVRQPSDDAMAAAAEPGRLAIHLRVRRWTLDEFAMPARLFEDIAEDLYRGDRFRAGTLRLGDEVARLADLAAPVAAVVNPGGKVVPPGSLLEGLRASACRERLVLRYRAEPGPAIQHLGPLVGPEAHARLWPRILDWLRRDEAAAG